MCLQGPGASPLPPEAKPTSCGPPQHGLPDACNITNGSSCPGTPSAPRCGVDFHSGRTLVLCLYGAIFLLGLATNALTLRPLLQQVRLGNMLAIYLLSLGISDVLYLSTLPLWMVYVSHDHQWTLGGPACHVAGFLFYSNMYVSILLLCAVSLERYLAVVHPLRFLGLRSRFSATVACASVALLVFLSHLAILSRAGGLQGASCYDSYPLQPGVATFNYLRVAAGFALPLLILGVSYLKVTWSVQASETLLGCQKAKVRHLSLGVMAIFLLCFAPYHVLLLARSLAFSLSDCCSLCAWERRLQLPFSLSLALSSLNSALDPVLYTLLSHGAKEDLRRAFAWRARASGAQDLVAL